MSTLSKALRNPNRLLQYAFVMSLIPLVFALRDNLIVPVCSAIVISILFLEFNTFKEKFAQWKRMDPVLRAGAFIMVFGFVFVPVFLWYGFDVQLNVIWVTFAAVILYMLGNNKLLDKIDEYPYRPILRSDIDDTHLTRSFDNFIVLMILGSFMTVSAILIESYILSNAREIFVVEATRWLIFFGLLLFHGLIFDLLIHEINWHTTSGYTQYEFVEDISPPRSQEPTVLVSYLHMIEKTKPDERFFDYLDDNLPELVKRFRMLEYTRALQSMVRIFAHWGEYAANKLHYLHLFIMASLSRYKVLSLVPMYNRHAFYTYIELLYKLQLLPVDWLEVIKYEIGEQKDMYHQLDWIVDIPYTTEIHTKLKWMSLWNLKVYKGQKGYNLLSEHMRNTPYDLGDMEDWEQDTWETTFTYLKMFVGKEGRTAFSGDFSLDDALDYLAEKKTLKEFRIAKQIAREELLNPKDRMVEVDIHEGDKERSAKQYLAFLEKDSYTDFDSSDEKFSIKENIKANLSEGPQLVIKWLIIVILAGVNLLLLYLIGQYLSEDIITLMVAIEIPAIFFFSVSTEMGGLMEENRVENEASIKPDRQFGTKTLQSGLSVGTMEKFIFGFLIIFGYVWFLV